MKLSTFAPEVDVEAPDKSCRVAHDAAVSRLGPIQDAIDYWNPGIGIIHLLGLAPAEWMAAPDNGPWAGSRGGAAKLPISVTVVTLCH
jgi:hypothetical protein